MSASMAEVLAEHYIASLVEGGWACYGKDCETDWGRFEEAMEHVAEQLAANGYGKLEDAWAAGYRQAKSDHCDNSPSAEYCDIESDNPYRRPE